MNINLEAVNMLKKESEKAFVICLKLNSDKKFESSANKIKDQNFNATAYIAEHILFRDIVKMYNDYILIHNVGISEFSIKSKFVLIYLYEKFLGTDLSKNYDLAELNELTKSKRFDENFSVIMGTSFFQSVEEMTTHYLTPAILKDITNSNINSIISFLNGIALLIKLEKTIPEKDQLFLKETSNKLNHSKIIKSGSNYNEIPEGDTLEIVLKELDELVGLDDIKNSIKDLTNFLKIQKIRKEQDLKTSINSLHAVFMGPPGTGKTTVARMLGRIYKHLGYLEKGHLVETDRFGMVAGYVGQTAIKSVEVIDSAIGGVLFIDEAYSLTPGSLNDFGSEAIEILLKRMEDNRNSMVVIVAGYSEEMELFIKSNSGLQSRFSRYFNFNHFTPLQLMEIFKFMAKSKDFILTPDAEDKLSEILERIYEKRDRSFGNARSIRNLFEKIIEKQANRIVSITPHSKDLLMTLTEDDIPEILKTVKEMTIFNEEEE